MTICWTQRILPIVPINKVPLDEGQFAFRENFNYVASVGGCIS